MAAKEKVVFCGDVVFSGGIAYSAKGMELWIKALNFIVKELQPKVVVPGHGAICGTEFVQEVRDYFSDILDQFEKYYEPGIDSLELAKKFDVSRYLHWLEPYRLFINVNALNMEKRGTPQPADWNYFATMMVKMKEFHDQKYGVQPWDPMSSWEE